MLALSDDKCIVEREQYKAVRASEHMLQRQQTIKRVSGVTLSVCISVLTHCAAPLLSIHARGSMERSSGQMLHFLCSKYAHCPS